jgi:hypothetical protein
VPGWSSNAVSELRLDLDMGVCDMRFPTSEERGKRGFALVGPLRAEFESARLRPASVTECNISVPVVDTAAFSGYLPQNHKIDGKRTVSFRPRQRALGRIRQIEM